MNDSHFYEDVNKNKEIMEKVIITSLNMWLGDSDIIILDCQINPFISIGQWVEEYAEDIYNTQLINPKIKIPGWKKVLQKDISKPLLKDIEDNKYICPDSFDYTPGSELGHGNVEFETIPEYIIHHYYSYYHFEKDQKIKHEVALTIMESVYDSVERKLDRLVEQYSREEK